VKETPPFTTSRAATSLCLFQPRIVPVTTTSRCCHRWKAHSKSSPNPPKSKLSDSEHTPTRRLNILCAANAPHAPHKVPTCHSHALHSPLMSVIFCCVDQIQNQNLPLYRKKETTRQTGVPHSFTLHLQEYFG
jgi:hypothetical protein